MSSPAEPLLPPTQAAARRAHDEAPEASPDRAPGEAPGDRPGTASEAAADTAAVLAAIYPALAHLLGPKPFAALCATASARSAAADVQPGRLIHALLLRREARTDDRIPSRLAADIAALEWSIHRLADRPQHAEAERPATPRDLLAATAAGCGPDDGWRVATLQPSRHFDIVPVAFRLDTWVRRVHQGRRMKRMPMRGEQHIVVHAPDRASGDAGAPVWWFALPPGPGTLLAHLALGQPIGVAVASAVHRGWMADEAAALEQLDGWLREGLFARVLPPEPARDAPPTAR